MVVLVVAVGGGVAFFMGTKSSYFTAKATFTLLDFSSTQTSGPTCQGSGGFSDLSPGAAVVVLDQDGHTVGATTLDMGHFVNDNCVWTINVDHVKSGARFYEVKVSHRDGPSYSESQMKAGVALSIGG